MAFVTCFNLFLRLRLFVCFDTYAYCDICVRFDLFYRMLGVTSVALYINDQQDRERERETERETERERDRDRDRARQRDREKTLLVLQFL